MSELTEQEKKDIATNIVEEFKKSSACPNGMDSASVESLKELLPELKEFVKLYKGGKTSVRSVIYGIILIGFMSIIVAGIYERLKDLFK